MREVNILSRISPEKQSVLQGYKDWNPFLFSGSPLYPLLNTHVAVFWIKAFPEEQICPGNGSWPWKSRIHV